MHQAGSRALPFRHAGVLSLLWARAPETRTTVPSVTTKAGSIALARDWILNEKGATPTPPPGFFATAWPSGTGRQ